MNLFILSYNPVECAQMMMDVHIVKIILEAVQMLSSAKRLLTVVVDPLSKIPTGRDEIAAANAVELPVYRVAHTNHPVSVWVRESYANYVWTLDLVDAMHDEWRLRYGHDKVHKSYEVAAYLRAHPPPLDAFACHGPTPFVAAMPDEYKVLRPGAEWWEDDVLDPVASYRAYYRSPMKRGFATWRVRGPPDWFWETE